VVAAAIVVGPIQTLTFDVLSSSDVGELGRPMRDWQSYTIVLTLSAAATVAVFVWGY